jgi:sirohydrochlorin cobaltochelatase
MMKTKRFMLAALLVAVLSLSMSAVCLAHGNHGHEHGHHHKKAEKQAILLVTFGTSIPSAQKVFRKVDRAYKQAFPGMEVRWAFTSAMIRKIVAQKQGKEWLSPEEALARLMAENYTQVAVQSLHVIPGAEYHDLVVVVQGFKSMNNGFQPLMGFPLCATTDDIQAVAKILAANLPKERQKKEAVVFMGHGTHHPAGVVYPALAYVLGKKHPLLLMGTVEGYPALNDVMARLKAKGIKKAYLLPFMTVAGDHAMNDMAGDEPDSWKSVLKAKGIKAVPVMRAITEIPQIVELYIAHTKKCLKRFH